MDLITTIESCYGKELSINGHDYPVDKKGRIEKVEPEDAKKLLGFPNGQYQLAPKEEPPLHAKITQALKTNGQDSKRITELENENHALREAMDQQSKQHKEQIQQFEQKLAIMAQRLDTLAGHRQMSRSDAAEFSNEADFFNPPKSDSVPQPASDTQNQSGIHLGPSIDAPSSGDGGVGTAEFSQDTGSDTDEADEEDPNKLGM